MAYQPKSYKKFVATAATATLVATALVPAASADQITTKAFTDVAPKYKDAVDFVVTNNIAKGKTETQFGIHHNIIRGDAAIMISAAAGLNDLNAPASGFSDVPTRGALAINSLKAAGVTNGKTPTSFDFNGTITRGEAAVFLANAFDLTGNKNNVKFTDVNARYLDAVAALVDNDVTKGKTATQFGTDQEITRGDFAVWLYALEHLIVGEEEAPAPEVAATVAVEHAEETLLEVDVAVAQKLVNDLPASDAKVLLNDRLAKVNAKIQAVIKGVNDARGELALYRALNTFPLVDVNEDYITAYDAAIGVEYTTLADIQKDIDAVNQSFEEANLTANLKAVADAFEDLDAVAFYSPDFDLEVYYDLVATAQAAINALPAEFEVDGETEYRADFQADLDKDVTVVENYFNFVSPVVNASNEVARFNALDAHFDNVVAENISFYGDFAGYTTVEGVQLHVDVVNAQRAIANFGSVDSSTTQAEINTLSALVDLVTDFDKDGKPSVTQAEGVPALIAAIKAFQDRFDALAESTLALEVAVAEAEAAKAAYVKAGGDVESLTYHNLLDALEDADDADSETIKSLNDATVGLETATNELIAYQAALVAADAAFKANIAAGGSTKSEEYKTLLAAIDTENTGAITDATKDLNELTNELMFVTDINSAKTATQLQPLLVELNVASYNNLPLVQRVEVADHFLSTIANGKFNTYALVTVELAGELDTEVADYKANLTAVNEAKDIASTNSALAGLGIEEYKSMTNAQRLVAAENVLNNKPTGGYTSFASIKAQF